MRACLPTGEAQSEVAARTQFIIKIALDLELRRESERKAISVG